ncbi:DUF4118 domain-containing protein [Naumannella halotolerans]|uniref:histidine kinase n=1 Tax=Naumannella halotolerans TaxID=993414 RepID=A0A4V3EP07_9ACTN|nr:DUF4118 domain-containing protein [Naumannella halotolerans]TDT34388.1 two-component system sensor histidine kinase KdpD [Naumannella halotolerans]
MGRGRLRVLLGAAPGVGKTYAMLEEGHRLQDEGSDVVVAIVETHGRKATARLCEGLEQVPRTTVRHRGVDLSEMDTEALIARRPAVALVDELAHTRAPGSAEGKRWQDVRRILDAGIDVISTLNIQHIESLNDVVEQITGVPQRETVPDDFLRRAEQIEVVDLAPQALRDRLSAGQVYPAERIDAALSNYFRLGNLTALRELALLWLADEVDSALVNYRAQQGISQTWEARERVVVALTGGPEGEILLRRGARIAARSAGGQLLAVHVVSQDGLRSADPALLAAQRSLVERLGGSYHQVVGDDVPEALVEFARGVNATQLVLGASRRGRLATALTGPGIGATVVRESGNIDVHLVTHAAAARPLRLPRAGGALSRRRRIAGFCLSLLAGPLLTIALVIGRSATSITSDVLFYQLLVVVVALVGGLWPAVFTAVMSGLTLNVFFIEPRFTVAIASPQGWATLLLYTLVAVLVSVVVDRGARQTRAARRAAAESEVVATVAGSVLRGQDAVQAIVERTREVFGLSAVRLRALGPSRTGGPLEAGRAPGELLTESVGEGANPAGGTTTSRFEVGERAVLELTGPDPAASERRLLNVLIAQLDAALEHSDLAETASEVAPLAASERVRSALLAALGHDLRRPLASATAAVSGLRITGPYLTEQDRQDLLETADDSLGALSTLINDLLDVSKLQAGALSITPVPVDPAEVIVFTLDELGLGPDDLEIDLAHGEREVLADPILLQRVLVNLLLNAQRYSPEGIAVRIATSTFADQLQIRVIDHGPGVPAERLAGLFVPFQREGDTDNTTGLGLGLALSRGFVEGMGGTIGPEDTPGGGLTMVITLELAGAGEPEATR